MWGLDPQGWPRGLASAPLLLGLVACIQVHGKSPGAGSGASGISGAAASAAGNGSSGGTSSSSGGTSTGGAAASGGSASDGGGTGTGGSTGTAVGSGSASSGGPGSTGAVVAGCGSACPAGSDCVLADGGAGACCDDLCVDEANDPGNCGWCRLACGGGTLCEAGSCVVFAPSCAEGAPGAPCALPDAGAGQCCQGACSDSAAFQSDGWNCGSCGNVCVAGSSCVSGECTWSGFGPVPCVAQGCPAGAACLSSPNGGSACVPQSCADGGPYCVLDGGALGLCCGGTCRDFQRDPSSCGGCGPCAAGQVCRSGECLWPHPCAPDSLFELCALDGGAGGFCCGASCVDIFSDPANCRACGATCPPGTTCFQGSCMGGGPSGASCPAGTATAGLGACVATTCGADRSACYLGTAGFLGLCCGGRCVDPSQDPANCGNCGVACASGICYPPEMSRGGPPAPEGACAPPGAGCGGCADGGACPAGDACAGDLCVPLTCPPSRPLLPPFDSSLCVLDGGVGACCLQRLVTLPDGGIAESPYCADVSSDPQNCGDCGIACPAGVACVARRCGDAGSR